MQFLSAVYFSKPISVPDWRGQKARAYLTSEEAEIRLDIDARIVLLAPKGQGTRTNAPLEAVTNWNVIEPEPKPSTKAAR